MDTEQIKALIKGCIGNDYETEILAAVCLGLRRGEVLGLRFGDFDFEKETVHIQQQVSDSKVKKESTCTYGIKSLKTENSNRGVYVPKCLLDSVKRRKIEVSKSKKKHGNFIYCNAA